jgi:hypothetical protein
MPTMACPRRLFANLTMTIGSIAAPRPDIATLRRAALFLVNVGFPIVAAAVLGEWRIALVGGVAAIMLSFADDDGPLRSRLVFLVKVAFGMAAGAAAGHWLGGYGTGFWVLFIAAAFAAGLLHRAGRAAHMAARVGAIALAIVGGLPAVSNMELALLAAVFVVCVLSRIVDNVLFGRLPRAPAPPPAPVTHAAWLRFAVAYAVAAGLAMWIGITFDPTRAIWVATTTLVVMQPDAGANYRRIVGRIVGTVAGVIAAFVLTQATHSTVLLCALMLAIAAALPHHLRNRYWLHTALIALLILLAYDLATVAGAGTENVSMLLVERLADVSMGCILALIGTAVAFPHRVGAPDGVSPDPVP